MPRRRVRLRPRPPAAGQIAVVTIGINYFGQRNELKGCVNDSNNFLTWARSRYGAKASVLRQLVDTLPKHHHLYPTRANIQRELQNITRMCNARGFTHLLIHYSGHGVQVRDRDGDEADGFDEALVPADYGAKGLIPDDWILKTVVNQLKPQIKLFGLIDACHSGTILDLRHTFDGQRWVEDPRNRAALTASSMMISGARDDQVAADVWDKQYGASGAMTTAFLRAASRGRTAPAWTIVQRMRTELKAKHYPQVPQLSCTRKLPVTRTPLYGIGDA